MTRSGWGRFAPLLAVALVLAVLAVSAPTVKASHAGKGVTAEAATNAAGDARVTPTTSETPPDESTRGVVTGDAQGFEARAARVARSGSVETAAGGESVRRVMTGSAGGTAGS